MYYFLGVKGDRGRTGLHGEKVIFLFFSNDDLILINKILQGEKGNEGSAGEDGPQVC